MKRPRISSLLWLPSLSAGGEIPMAFLVFVSLVMFAQLGASNAQATAYASLLMVPWLLRPVLHPLLGRCTRPKWGIVASEGLAAAVFGFVSWNLHLLSLPLLSLCLMMLGFAALFHQDSSHRYRRICLDASHRRLLGQTLSVLQHLVVLLAYGAFIMLVGVLQIYYRRFSLSWMMGCRLLAVAMLMQAVYHLKVLRPVGNERTTGGESPYPDATRRGWKEGILLFLLLLPQSLMFHTRTLFLLNDSDRGGLGCALPEIGFAQGTVGLIAFILGFSVYHRLGRRLPPRRLFLAMGLPIGLSPLVYLLFATLPPEGLWMLCLGIFLAQFCFGMGLGACGSCVLPSLSARGSHFLSLYAPAVLAAMILPMALCGGLVQQWGYPLFFLLDSLSGLLSWLCFWGYTLPKKSA